MNVAIELAPPPRGSEEPCKADFGKQFLPGMVVTDWHRDRGWTPARLVALESWPLSPFTAGLHYGQSVFEGLKAHRAGDGRVAIFRAQSHGERLARSAARMALPPVAVADFVALCTAFVSHQQPQLNAHDAMYLRPLLFASEAALGVHASHEARFAVLGCIVGEYFKTQGTTLRIQVCEKYVRAAPGGTGFAKTAGNYAASLLAQAEAAREGFHQVLWLDAVERAYVEETGAMNVAFITGKTILTPPTGDTILDGITRKSVLALAPSLGLGVEERRIRWTEVAERIASGDITEAFGIGTAALIAPIGEFGAAGKVLRLTGGEQADRIKAALRGEQRGAGSHGAEWLTYV
jgi:branched-chain amino acid aminotransferase